MKALKALFYTTTTVDCSNHVQAWNSCYPQAIHIRYDLRGICNDWQLLETIEREQPDVVFYIGANDAPGNPKVGTLQIAQKRVPVINFCSDAADRPWHRALEAYKRKGCFALQVSIDGAKDAPVDLATLTPIDPEPFAAPLEKTIRCGFSGTVGRWNARSEVVLALSWFGGLQVRDRVKVDGYESHVDFLKRCRIILNISNTGSGLAHHIKGRVLEAGWARAALLESEGSPIGDWFPSDCYITYRNPKEAADIIASLSDAEIDRCAERLAHEVRTRFTPAMIYGDILQRIDIHTKAINIVDTAIARPAA